MTPHEPTHIPVMRDRIVALLAPALSAGDAVLVDATLGLGGHSAAVLDACPHARLVGIDRDPDALAVAGARLARFGDRVRTFRARFDELPDVLAQAGCTGVHAMLFDLGVSSMQLDTAERGFAYSYDAPLDMRMDPAGSPSAADVVNTYPADRLARVLREFGEERFARRIADAIVAERSREPITSTARLAELVRDSIPAPARRTGGNPAKRTFQALRIEVNSELVALRTVLPAAMAATVVGGRIVVMSYHSGEDRMVKRAFARATTADVPPGLPVVPQERRPRFALLTRGAETPTPAELENNPRSASVRVRAVERVATEVAA